MVEVRIAKKQDAQGVLDIYSPYVLYHATSFETLPPSVAEMEARISHYQEKFPWLVCIVNQKIVGYAYASPYKEREAYQWCCESSVYVLQEYHGKGLAKELYTLLFDLLKEQGFRNVIAGITQPNPASVRLHEGFGFKLLAVYENIGYKLGSWKSVGWWRLALNEFSAEPPPPLSFSQIDRLFLTKRCLAASEKINSNLT